MRNPVPINPDPAYGRLQRHLDQQAVGFPATGTGAGYEILKHIFTPREADIATCLSYRFEPLDRVFEKALPWVDSTESLAAALASMQKKGGIESKVERGERYYCLPPLVVGMYEFQLNRLTPDFIRNFKTYTSHWKFGLAFLSTELPQMRTIPISKSITPRYSVSTYDQVQSLIQEADPPFAVFECICRKKKAITGEPCLATERKETCLAVGHLAQCALDNGSGRAILADEAMDIIERNQKDGLVLQPSNTEKAEFICSCCGCCCGMLSLHKRLPLPADFWANNFQCRIEPDKCSGCGTCQKRCQVGAVRIDAKHKLARIDRNHCIGCGLCVPTCPTWAMRLVEKPGKVTPPENRQVLYERIMGRKKGLWGKMRLSGKLLIDFIRAGRIRA